MVARPPVVVILGHVDHGKTTLLDYIRRSHIAEKEYGNITQKIGAYEIKTEIKGYKNDKITFIDTPGHEAFAKLRVRGTNVADLAILLIDAKDSVMPQTIESISHINAAKIPFIVAINKIDLPEANPEKVKKDLIKHGVLVEEKGGKIPIVYISAKTGKGVNELLELILLLSADFNLTYNPNNPPLAFVVETKKDKRGIVASVILKDGCLKVGDTIYTEEEKTKVRAIINDQGIMIEKVFPSTPFELLGFKKMPKVGSIIQTQPPQVNDQLKTSSITQKKIKPELLFASNNKTKKLSLIIKADSVGSLEAISGLLENNDKIEIISKGIGEITKSDVFLAKTTKSIIIGFAVETPGEVKNLANQEKIIIKTYNIIYELEEELTEVTNLLIDKERKEKNLKGEAKILATFVIEKERVYGVQVTKGKINLGDTIEVYKNDKFFGKTKLVSLKIRAKKVEEVKKGDEAGMIFSPLLDISVGDVVKSIL